MQTPAHQHDFFLCHAGPDKGQVDSYDQRLKRLGATTAFDKHDIRPGQDWVDRILTLLPNSKICTVFVSAHSSQALVQSGETFLARHLERQYPGRHKVIPVYLKGAPPQTSLAGLQTTSAFREDQQSADDIAQGLMEELRRLGDAADQVVRAVEIIDTVALKWLFPQGYDSFGTQYRLRGNQLVLQEGSWEANAISRDQFENLLSADDRRMIAHIETKMERLFVAWQKHDLDSVTSLEAQDRADEFARRLGAEVFKLLDLLQQAGFSLLDHYGHIRSVVASYQQRTRPPGTN